MLDAPVSRTPTRFAFGESDEVVLNGVSHRVISRKLDGWVLQRSEPGGIAERFDDAMLEDLSRKGVLTHRPNAFAPREVVQGQIDKNFLASSLTGKPAMRMHFRYAYVQAFLEHEELGKVKRTDESMERAMLKVSAEANVKLGLVKETKSYAGSYGGFPKPPNVQTLRTWVKNFEDLGLEGLVDARQRSGNHSRRISLEVLAIMGPIVQSFASQFKPTKDDIFQRVCDAIELENEQRVEDGRPLLTPPSRETVRKEINALDPFTTILKREGEAAARKAFAPVTGGLKLDRPLQRVEMDEWTIDLMSLMAPSGLLDHLTEAELAELQPKKKKDRWVVTVAMCATTRCIMGMTLSKNPSSSCALQTIEMVTRDKLRYSTAFGALCPWNMRGVPELVVTDNGSAFKSIEFRTGMHDLKVRTERPPAGLAELRGRIERLFGTMSRNLMQHLSGRTFSDIITKGDNDPREGAALTADELAEAMVRWIVDIYHNTPHEGLYRETPANAWNRLVAEYGVRPAPDMKTRRQVFGVKLSRKLGKKGLRVFGVQYHVPALAKKMLRKKDLKLELRWHPDDLGAIEVETDTGWVEVKAVDDMFHGLAAEDWYRTVNRLRKTFRKQAVFSRAIVRQAVRDIRAMNARAMAREGVKERNFSPEHIALIEERMMMNFDIEDDGAENLAGQQGDFGLEFTVGGTVSSPEMPEMPGKNATGFSETSSTNSNSRQRVGMSSPERGADPTLNVSFEEKIDGP